MPLQPLSQLHPACSLFDHWLHSWSMD